MERVLSQDERIRRAEEIYARRQNVRERTKRATVNISEPKNFRLLKRVALQALICLLIYFIFYLINTTNYSFSEVTLDRTEDLISQDVDFLGIYNNIINTINSYISNLRGEEKETNEENEVEGEITKAINAEAITEEEVNNIEENAFKEQSGEGVNEGNSTEEAKAGEQANENIAINTNEEDTSQEEITEAPLSETDRIKQNYSFILPVKRMGFFRIWRKRAII